MFWENYRAKGVIKFITLIETKEGYSILSVPGWSRVGYEKGYLVVSVVRTVLVTSCVRLKITTPWRVENITTLKVAVECFYTFVHVFQ